MSKKKNWFARVKGIFFSAKDEHKDQLKNKKKKKKRWVFGWKRTTKKPPSLAAPLPVDGPAASEEAGASSSTTTNAQHPGLTLPTSSSFGRQCEDYSAAKILLHRAQLVQHVELLAAIKIQTAFRGYLARKALRALKGLVRLQAMIRGRAVRRQAVATLKSLQSIVNIQSQVCATRYQKANEIKQNEDPRDVKFQRRRDHTLLMKDDEHAILLSKTEAMLRRNRHQAYSFNHRHSADVEDGRIVGRLRRWVEKYEECDVPTKEEIKRVDTIGGKQQIRLRNAQFQHAAEAAIPPRSSFESRHRRATSQLGNKLDVPPAYMAATESARARVRSMSSARLVRPMQLESYSDGDSPYKSKLLSPMLCVNSERNCISGAVGAMVPSGSYNRHRSCTGFKGIGGSMRWNRNVPDLGPENGRWLMNWN